MRTDCLLNDSDPFEVGSNLELDDIHHNPSNPVVVKTMNPYKTPKKETLFNHLVNVPESRNVLQSHIELSSLLNDKHVKREIIKHFLRSPEPVRRNRHRKCITQRISPERNSSGPSRRSRNKPVKD